MPQIVLNGTTGIANATWTTATRPASPVAGQTGYNTDIGAMETYTGSAWSTSDLPATGASGNFLQSNGTAWTSASTLGVANGGTGVTTLTTAYGVLAAGTTATGALQNIGTGTASQVLTSNGPGVLPSFQAAAAGGFSNMTVFTSPGTFTTPSTTTKIKVTVVGGGGGGGGGSSSFWSGGGGGGSAIYVGPVTASTGYAVTVGAGGVAKSTAPGAQNGDTGGTSSFGVLASATGGGGGTSTPTAPAIVAGGGGAGSSGTLQFTGGAGSTSAIMGPTSPVNGNGTGGSSYLGGGGRGGQNPTNASPGGNYGGGGGGGTVSAGGPTAAGAGGVVVVEY